MKLTTADQPRGFPPRYFQHYAGRNKPYRSHFKASMNSPLALAEFLRRNDHAFPQSVLDVGAADGSGLKAFGRALGAPILHGVETSVFAVRSRIVPDIYLKDMRDIVRHGQNELRRTYDLILLNALMYLAPAELVPLLRDLKALTHPGSLALLTLPSFYPWCLYSYLEEHRRACGSKAPLIMRPKPWWIQAVQQAGWQIIHDLDGNGLLLSVMRRARRALDPFGRSDRVECAFGDEAVSSSGTTTFHGMELRHTSHPVQVRLVHRKTREGNEFVEKGPTRRGKEAVSFLDALQDFIAFLRSGRAGRDPHATFRAVDVHRYVPGALILPDKGGYSVTSDRKF